MKLVYVDGPKQSYLENTFLNETDLENCDLVLSCKFEHGCNNKDYYVQSVLDNYANINKPVILILVSDSEGVYNIPDNCKLYRTSLIKSKKQKNEEAMPHLMYIGDCIFNFFQPAEILDKPTLSFCGFATDYRSNILNFFENDNRFITNFIKHNSFWAGVSPDNREVRENYVNNMLSSIFVISPRGAGNFSIRFFESLKAGRIPVVLNSDNEFPFENEISYDEFIIRGNCLHELAYKILFWFRTKNLFEIQKKCREIYYKYFISQNFFSKILS